MTEDPIACGVCGRTPTGDEGESARYTWTRGVERQRTVWSCPECSRVHLREIEGKLDSEWW